jgi:hypothetical protein
MNLLADPPCPNLLTAIFLPKYANQGGSSVITHLDFGLVFVGLSEPIGLSAASIGSLL